MALVYKIKASHIAEKLKLRELKERYKEEPLEFSNYEMILKLAEDSYVFIYNFGSVVFFNVPEDRQERELSRIQEYRTPSELARTSDIYQIEVQESLEVSNKVYFDRVIVQKLMYEKIKMTCNVVAESTALEYYEILIENLMEKTNRFSKKLEREGRILESSEDLIKFIGMCLNTKQEIISNLYIVDSPDETWESVELDRLYQDVKQMFEADIRYRALDYKIRIIQESIEIIVDLAKSKRETMLELVIIILIAFEVIMSLLKWKN